MSRHTRARFELWVLGPGAAVLALTAASELTRGEPVRGLLLAAFAVVLALRAWVGWLVLSREGASRDPE